MISGFIERWEPKDIIALVVLIFSLCLIAKGINHIVSGLTIMIVTYYFRKRTEQFKEANKWQKKETNQKARRPKSR